MKRFLLVLACASMPSLASSGTIFTPTSTRIHPVFGVTSTGSSPVTNNTTTTEIGMAYDVNDNLKGSISTTSTNYNFDTNNTIPNDWILFKLQQRWK